MKSVALNILIAGIVIVIAFVYIERKEANLVEQLVVEINNTKTEMEQTAKTTGLAQVDAVADSIVRDCSVRDRYEGLLGRLDTLSEAELREVQQLHAQCSHYYPTQKAFMANQLETLVSDYASLVAILDNIKAVAPEEYKVEDWKSLVTKESNRSSLLRQQYEIQGRIISALIEANGEEITNLLEEAKKVADSLNVISIQINQEREALVSI